MWFFALFRDHGVFFSITLKRTIEINLQIEEFSCGQGGITARCVKVRLYGVHGFCFMTCFQKMMVQCLGGCATCEEQFEIQLSGKGLTNESLRTSIEELEQFPHQMGLEGTHCVLE